VPYHLANWSVEATAEERQERRRRGLTYSSRRHAVTSHIEGLLTNSVTLWWREELGMTLVGGGTGWVLWRMIRRRRRRVRSWQRR